MNIAVFAYNFPHKKTQDFILRLLMDGFKPKIVLANDFVELNIPKSVIRVKPRHVALIHPQNLCERLDIPYVVVDHNSEECKKLVQEHAIDLGIVAGARILKEDVFRIPRFGVINFHPGYIPEVRGLDALQWAIYQQKPLGVTAHQIDKRIDAGYIIERRIIKEYHDDSLIDLSLRLYETQLEMIKNAIHLVSSKPISEFEFVGRCEYNKKMPMEIEKLIPDLLRERLSKQ